MLEALYIRMIVFAVFFNVLHNIFIGLYVINIRYIKNRILLVMKSEVRVIIPRKIDHLLILAELIEQKYDATLVDNPLQHFSMVVYKEKLAIAKFNHDVGWDLYRLKLIYYQERNNALGISPKMDSSTQGTVLFYLKSIRDYLLGIYKGREQMLGDWGFIINSSTTGRVNVQLSRKVDKLLALAKSVLAKHALDGGSSILSIFDMDALAAIYAIADEKNEKAKQTVKDKEKHIMLRDLALGFRRGDRKLKPDTLLFFITSIRDILLGHHKGLEHYLGNWGFEVNSSKRKKNAAEEATDEGGDSVE